MSKHYLVCASIGSVPITGMQDFAQVSIYIYFFSGSISVDKQAHELHVTDWQSQFLFEEVLLFLIVWHGQLVVDGGLC